MLGVHIVCGTWVGARFLDMPWFMELLIILLYVVLETWLPCYLVYLYYNDFRFMAKDMLVSYNLTCSH